MATSQTFSAQCSAVGSFGYASYFKLYAKLEETDVSTSGNSSKIKYTVYCQSSGSGSINAKHFKYFKLNGTEIKNATESVNVSSPNAYIAIASGTTGAIGHDTDGSKSVSFSAQIKGSSYGVSASLSGTFALTKIARYFSSTPTITLSSKTETTMTYTWKTSETCNGLTWNGGGTMSGFSSGTSGTITISGLSANTSYSHYGTFKRSDSGLTSNSGTSTNSTYAYPYCNSAPNFTIGNNVTLGFYNPLNRNITIQMWSHNSREFVSDLINISGTSYTGFSDVASRLYQSIPSTNSSQYNIDVYYGSNKAIKGGGYYSIRGDEVPTFNDFDFSAENTYSLTGDYKKIIKGYSIIHAFIDTNNKATPNYYASGISRYVLNTSAGNYEANFSADSRVDIYSLNVNTNQVTVYAVDSRGISKSVTKTGELMNYSNVGVYSAYASRENNVGEKVTLGFSAYIWNGNFGAVQNAVQSIGYKYKLTSSNTWTDGTTELTYSISGNTLTGSCLIAGDLGADGFNVENSYNIYFYFSDKLSSAAYTITIGSGTPAIAIYKNKVAIGKKYDTSLGTTLQVNGDLDFSNNSWAGIKWKEDGFGDKFEIRPQFSGTGNSNYLGLYAANGDAGTNPDVSLKAYVDSSGNILSPTTVRRWKVPNNIAASTHWYVAGYGTITGYANHSVTLLVEQNFGGDACIVHFNIRCDNGNSLVVKTFKVIPLGAEILGDYFRITQNENNYWFDIYNQYNYGSFQITVLNESNMGNGSSYNIFNAFTPSADNYIDGDPGGTKPSIALYIPKNGSPGYGLCNSDGMSIIKDYNNSNVTVDATGGVLYLGFRNTTGLNILDGKITIDSTNLKTYSNVWVAKSSGAPTVALSRDDYTNSIIIYAGANNSGAMVFGVSATGGISNAAPIAELAPTAFYPRTNAELTLGKSNTRWGQIYSSSSTISTSDRNLKKDIEEYTDEYNVLFDNLKPVKFKFKGKEHDRIHTGFISQDVEDALETAKLTAMDFAGFCKDQKQIHEVEYNDEGEEIRSEFIDQFDEEGNPIYEYSLRYEDFISLNTWQIQKLKKEIEELKEEIKNLKNK